MKDAVAGTCAIASAKRPMPDAARIVAAAVAVSGAILVALGLLRGQALETRALTAALGVLPGHRTVLASGEYGSVLELRHAGQVTRVAPSAALAAAGR
ncbi:hypothetical protein ACFQ9X_34040 [Catenulispora yoronensis]